MHQECIGPCLGTRTLARLGTGSVDVIVTQP